MKIINLTFFLNFIYPIKKSFKLMVYNSFIFCCILILPLTLFLYIKNLKYNLLSKFKTYVFIVYFLLHLYLYMLFYTKQKEKQKKIKKSYTIKSYRVNCKL